MPDVTFEVNGVTSAEESEKLERALTRLEFVELVNVDSERGLVAVSYDGGEEELGRIEGAIEEAGYEAEPSPGADPDVG
jgi:copper chaperone CopZ